MASQPPELYSLQVSPWSLKARWALKHHGIVYRTVPFVPLLSELQLRWRLWRWTGRITAPVLLTSEGALCDSFDISLWADKHAAPGAQLLLPAGKQDEIKRWNELSDAILFYGRQRLLELASNDWAIRRQLLPAWLRGLGLLSDWIAKQGVSKFAVKYQKESQGASRDKAEAALKELRAALQKGGGSYIIGGAFSYADIVMAAALQPVKPVGPPYSRNMGPMVKMDYIPGAQQEYQDLLAWRDNIYSKHFPLTEGGSKKLT